MVYNEILNENALQTDYLADITLESVEESQYEPTLEGAMMHVLEAEENWNALQQRIGIIELAKFSKAGEEVVFEAEESESLFTKVINWFKTQWGKFVAFCKKFINAMAAKVKSDAAFVKKFENAKVTVPKDFKKKIYPFNIGFRLNHGIEVSDTVIKNAFSMQPSLDISKQTAETELEKFKAGKEAVMSALRGASMGLKEAVDSKEYSKKLIAKFRSGKTEAEETDITETFVKTLVPLVKSTKESVTAANDDLKAMKGKVNKIIDDLNKAKKTFSSKENKANENRGIAMKYVNNVISLRKEQIGLLTKVTGAKCNALHQQNRQAKAIMYSLLSAGGIKLENAPVAGYGDLFGDLDFQ